MVEKSVHDVEADFLTFTNATSSTSNRGLLLPMAKTSKAASKRASRRDARDDDTVVVDHPTRNRAVRKSAPSPQEAYRERKPLKCRTKAQSNYLQMLQSKPLVMGLGPAGTGKSYIAAIHACQELDAKRINQIIITRPAVEAEEKLGFLPGEIEEKMAPYFEPIRDIFEEYFGVGAVECMLKNKRIVVKPLAYMRGKTHRDCIVLLDEAQNTTPGQMQLILTRIGENCQMIIDGDTDQVDIQGLSGLVDALTRLEGMEQLGLQIFEENDIVRSGLCKEIVKRYRNSNDKK